MKRTYILLLLILTTIFLLDYTSFAATVGNPLDLDIPSQSAVLRQKAIDEALDEYESIMIKTGLDLEFVFDKDLDTTSELKGAEMVVAIFKPANPTRIEGIVDAGADVPAG